MQRGQTTYVNESTNDVNKLYLYTSQLNINNIVTCYHKLWTIHMVHLSKRWCYSNRWLWVRLNLADVLKMERYPFFNFFLILGHKLTILEQSCTLQGLFTLTPCHVLTAKYSNYLLSYSGFFWQIICINILNNMCPEIIMMSSLTQQLFNSGYDKWLPSRKYVMSHVFSN